MDDYSLYNLAETYARAYLRLPETIHGEFDLVKEIRKDEVVYEEYTLGDVAEGLFEVLKDVSKMGRLPVVNFAAGGVATPADAAFMMQLGADGVFVGSGIFKSSNPQAYAKAIVQAVEHYDEPEVVAEVSRGLGEPMRGLDVSDLEVQMQERGV